MAYTDILFLFLFLPISLLLYYICKERLRKYVLLALSIVFYACGSFVHLALVLVSVGINILLGRAMDGQRERAALKKGILGIGVLYNVSILLYYKYTDFLLLTVGRVTGADVALKNLILPMGLSFLTFRAISYLADIYHGSIAPRGNMADGALYLLFFPQIQSGPLARYSDMQADGEAPRAGFLKTEGYSEGCYRFITGFNKKILLANTLSNITSETFAVGARMSTAYAWLGAVCYSLQLYFDFSGYSDMAIGVGMMLGYRCPENFRYPYMTESVSRFWRRWHITLGAWFRDYVYIPLGGSRAKKRSRCYLNLLAVWALTGLWHGASWNFLFWGLGYFLAIWFERVTGWPEKFRSKAGKCLYRAGVLLFINFQWVIFRAEGLREGLRYIRNMLLFAADPLADARAMFLLGDYLAFILAAVIFCFPVVPWLEKCLARRKATAAAWEMAVVLVNGFLLVWAVSFVVAGRNDPFVYANF